MRKGILIGGIVLLILSFVAFVYPFTWEGDSVMTTTLTCGSFEGGLAKALASEMRTLCNWILLISAVLGSFMITGIVLIIIGAVKKSKSNPENS